MLSEPVNSEKSDPPYCTPNLIYIFILKINKRNNTCVYNYRNYYE